MGILNMTPDSFSGDGLGRSVAKAVDQAARMVEEGADILDVGGESTRPGAPAVPIEEELERVIPVIEALAERFPVRISIDTRKAEVAEVAIETGATILNDITAGADIRMALLAKSFECEVILMHMQGDPQTMQVAPSYPHGVVGEVIHYLESRVRLFTEMGIAREKLWVDPGIGFGKTLEHNLTLLRDLDQLDGIGERIVIGTSRKSFIAKALRDPALPVELREPGTIASCLWALTKGASVFRVHDVGAAKSAIALWERIDAGL